MRAIVSALYPAEASPRKLKSAYAAMMCSIVGSSVAAFFAGRFLPKLLQAAILISLALATIGCMYGLPDDVMLQPSTTLQTCANTSSMHTGTMVVR